MYATKKRHNYGIWLKRDIDNILPVRLCVTQGALSTRVEESDWSSLTQERARQEEERIDGEVKRKLEDLQGRLEEILDDIADLQSLHAYRRFIHLGNLIHSGWNASTGNRFEKEEGTDGSIRGRIANSLYEFRYGLGTGGTDMWHAGWRFGLHCPLGDLDDRIVILSSCTDRTFDDDEKAKKYITERYAHFRGFFTEEIPPVPTRFKDFFTIHGNVIEGIRFSDDMPFPSHETVD